MTANKRFVNALSATEHGGAVGMLDALDFDQTLQGMGCRPRAVVWAKIEIHR